MPSEYPVKGGKCDEGGQHKWTTRQAPSSCGWIGKILCCPCYCLCGILMSNGAAGASQYQFKAEEDGEIGQETCSKCGLTPSEATALNDVQYNERHGMRTSKGPMYFNNAMTLPPTPPPPSHSPHSPNTLHSPQQQQHRQSISHPPSPNSNSNPNRNSGAPPLGGGETRQDQAVGNWLATLPSNNQTG